jgi:pSer/pThr/pTyr-binding forkhead associated (FHA) protein
MVVPALSHPYDQATLSRKEFAIASALNGTGGAASGRRVEVTGPMVIGREEADITVEDQEISRRHAEVRPSGDAIEIEDLGSTNGTFVNEERITGPRTLAAGDVVRVGQSEFEAEAEAPSRSGTVVAATPPPQGTSISESPSQPPAADDTVPDVPATGTAAGAPPAVESWSPAPTGAGAGGPSAPPAGAYQPPPAGGYSPPPQQQGYGTQQQGGYGGSGYPTQGAGPGYGAGSYGASDKGKGGKGPLIAGIIVVVLLLIAGLLFFTPLGESVGLKDSDEDKVRAVVTEFGETIDDPAVCDLLTQRFIEEITGSTGSEAVDACRTDVEENPGEPAEVTINSVEIDGDTATVQAEAEGQAGTFNLVKQDGEWLIDSTEGGP